MLSKTKLINTPVVIFAYNRPNHLSIVIETLSQHQFKNLIFILDGPKTEADIDNCLRVRKLVERDWGCQVDIIDSEVNLGCKNRITTGLDIVFQRHESAIILEDDCLPANSFFDFCESMLQIYKNDSRILMACGTVLVEPSGNQSNHFFSNLPHIWGWATWRDRWAQYPKNITTYDQFYALNKLSGFYPEHFASSLCDKLRKIASSELDTWDAQMTYLAVSQNLLSVFPNKNLIKNIGFDKFATHTIDPSVLSMLSLGVFNGDRQKMEIILPLRDLDLKRMLIEGHAGCKLLRLVKILSRQNGLKQVLSKLLRSFSK